MNITDFYKNIYVDQASYDNIRKIASALDGQKNAARKILYTILEKNIDSEIKVSQLGSKVAEFADYLHGNMDGVIVNLAQNFAGTNNIPLLDREGQFGTRFQPEASASRYIYTNGSKELWKLFSKEDSNILIEQYFEGHRIEPLFYIPNLPIILINGSVGVSSGFAQKILSRDAENIKKLVKQYLKNSKIDSKLLVPSFNGFSGNVEQGENDSQWLIKGVVKKISNNKVEISEVPVGYNLKSYLDVLDKLEDDKVINSYKDKSENDKFLFEVNFNSVELKSLSEENLLQKLKLVEKITENYTCMDENNKIVSFNSSEEIFKHYIKIKLEFLQKRKDFQLEKLEQDIKLDYSKYLFIKNITENKLIISKRKKSDIESDLEKIPGIIQRDSSFDYLLQMNIMSLTEERMTKLENDIRSKKAELDDLKTKDVKDIWLGEL